MLHRSRDGAPRVVGQGQLNRSDFRCVYTHTRARRRGGLVIGVAIRDERGEVLHNARTAESAGVEAFKCSWRHAVRRLRRAASGLRCRVTTRGGEWERERERGETVQGSRVAAGGRAVEPSIDFMIRRQDLAGDGGQLCRRAAPARGRRRVVAAIDRSYGLQGGRRYDSLVNCILKEGVVVGIPRILVRPAVDLVMGVAGTDNDGSGSNGRGKRTTHSLFLVRKKRQEERDGEREERRGVEVK